MTEHLTIELSEPVAAIEAGARASGLPRQAAAPTRDDTVCALRRHRADFERLGVSHLYLFGSAAREEMNAISDVDLFFDHRRGEVGLFEIMDIRDRATAILGRAADVTTRAGLHPRLRMAIESEALRIF